MIKGQINYFHSKTTDMEIVYCKNSHISYPEHNHISVYTIGLIIEGSLELARKDETNVYYADDLFVVLPYEPHAIVSGKGGYTTLSICINKSHFLKFDMMSTQAIFMELTNYLTYREIISKGQVKLLADRIDMLYKSIIDKPFVIDNTFSLTKNLLEVKPENEINLDELSLISFTSKYHFIRQFKKNIGLTPHQFQIQNRIRKAQRLLLQKQTATEVALVTGFYDQSHFNKCFKKIVGLTPSEYLHATMFLPN